MTHTRAVTILILTFGVGVGEMRLSGCDSPAVSPRSNRPAAQRGATRLERRIARIGGKPSTLRISARESIASDTTVPENVTLEFTANGSLDVDEAATLRIAGEFVAPARQIFAGGGSVLFLEDGFDAIRPEWWGARPDGESDAGGAINRAVRAVGGVGAKIRLGPGVFGVKEPLDGSVARIELCGEPGSTVIRKIADERTPALLSQREGAFEDWTFRDLELDGSVDQMSIPDGLSILLQGMTRINFRDCRFRGLKRAFFVQSSSQISFVRCTFLGTRQIREDAASPARKAKQYTSGVQIDRGSSAITFQQCEFRYLRNGILVHGAPDAPVKGIRIEGCTFVADWWNTPIVNSRIVATAYDTKTRILTVASGGLAERFLNREVLSIPVTIAAGTSFQSTSNGIRASVPRAELGDVIELSSGFRAQITRVISSTEVGLGPWESIETYEPVSVAPNSGPWKLVRYFASSATSKSDTTLKLYCDPVNVFSGETIGTTGFSIVGSELRELAKLTYSGTHVSGGASGISIENCSYRGSWADQCSNFDARNVRITNCSFEYGQDEHVTITRCPGAQVSGCTFVNAGVSAVYVGGSADSVVADNRILNWGLVNRHGLGAINGHGARLVIRNNTACVDQSAGRGGDARYMIRLAGRSEGTVLTKNEDFGAREGSIFLSDDAGNVQVREQTRHEGPSRGCTST